MGLPLLPLPEGQHNTEEHATAGSGVVASLVHTWLGSEPDKIWPVIMPAQAENDERMHTIDVVAHVSSHSIALLYQCKVMAFTVFCLWFIPLLMGTDNSGLFVSVTQRHSHPSTVAPTGCTALVSTTVEVCSPGIDTMPTTFIWLRIGVSATRTHRCSDACVASHRVAPSASSCSILSFPAMY